MPAVRFRLDHPNIEERLREIAVTVPHGYEVVKDVYECVKDFDMTLKILEFSCQRFISVYAILEAFRYSK
jgi:hypothetical protein